MERILTIGEIEDMDVLELQGKLTNEQKEKIDALGITAEQFLNEFKDKTTLSGEEDDFEFMSISDFIAHLEEMDRQMNEELGDIETIGEAQEKVSTDLTISENSQLQNFSGLNNGVNKPQIITNIKDKKLIFNLGKTVDKLLNDCEGQVITIDKVLIKKYSKETDEPVVNEETGEITGYVTKTSMSIVIVDENGVSYATGSKTFGYSLLDAIYNFGNEMKGLKIKVIKVLKGENKNKSLDFELV